MSDHEALDQAFIAHQRNRLEVSLSHLLAHEHDSLAEERDLRRARGVESEEFEEQAQQAAQREVDQELRDLGRRRIRDIERALQKIEEGSYGRSDLSGEPIPRQRLEQTPEALLTVDEERARERRH